MPLLVIMLVVLLITSATGALVTAAAISGPTLVISPSSGKAGSWAKATGSMFSEEGDPEFPPETIIRFNGIEVASAYGGGSFTLSFQVPSGIPPGDYPVQAICNICRCNAPGRELRHDPFIRNRPGTAGCAVQRYIDWIADFMVVEFWG